MKKLFAILSVVLFANQASADLIRADFISVGDVYVCRPDKVFQVTAAPKAEIEEYEILLFEFTVNEGNITFGKKRSTVLADQVFILISHLIEHLKMAITLI